MPPALDAMKGIRLSAHSTTVYGEFSILLGMTASRWPPSSERYALAS